VLAAVKTTSLLLLGDPMDQSGSWLVLLLCFDLVYWSLCLVLTSRVIEE
jgi:heme exporter protein B